MTLKSSRICIAVVAALVLLAAPAAAQVDIASSYGSGAFGTWTADRFGLPAYAYTSRDPADHFAQIGNDHIVATAHSGGHTQLWSQDRTYQWVNYFDQANGHYGGGYGYLRVGGRTYSTAGTQRTFGAGYTSTALRAGGLAVQQHVYAPFGDDPVLLHDVTLRNPTKRALRASWFEFWDVNPYEPGPKSQRGLDAPKHSGRTLSVRQAAEGADNDPLTIYASALRAPVSGFDTDRTAFFGSGSRVRPAAVVADRAHDSLAPATPAGASGTTMFAFRSPVVVPPGRTVTLRYAYGAAHAAAIPRIVHRYSDAADPLGASERAWADWLPQVSFGSGRSWLSRELQWDAYMVRSGSTWEDCHGAHILSQGGYYQYVFAIQAAFRDPLQHVLPIIYSDPALARDVLRYSAGEQDAGTGALPYAVGGNCARQGEDGSDDSDLWLLNAVTEYVLATRDTGFLNTQVPFADGSSATLWEHLKLAYRHQEAVGRGPHGGYLPLKAGDWSDGTPKYLGMTESMLVPAQLAYVYPRLALVADRLGDGDFASTLRTTAAGLAQNVSNQWTGGGWYTRGWAGDFQLGSGAIFGEPQPWAILAGIPSPDQARTLVANIRRYLTGIGAPHGPTRIGSSLTPGTDDPGVTERSQPPSGIGDNNSNYVGGTWYAVNGWLTWALGTLEGVVPGAVRYAWDEFERNTLARHATVFPRAWDGVVSVDDACNSYYATAPDKCGIGFGGGYETQILHQPAWALFDAIRLAGITPTQDGYRIAPHLPFRRFSLRFPVAGVEGAPGELRGYVKPVAGGRMTMEVVVPGGRATTFVNGHAVRHAAANGAVRFALPTRAGKASAWVVRWR